MESSNPSKSELYDELRKKWLVATPEEYVRQRLVKRMIEELSFPRELLTIEKSLGEMPHISFLEVSSLPQRRTDIVCFGKEIHPKHALYPLLVVECKEHKGLASAALEQVLGYNYYLKAYFVAVAHPEGVEWGFYDKEAQKYTFLPILPSFPELMQAVRKEKGKL